MSFCSKKKSPEYKSLKQAELEAELQRQQEEKEAKRKRTRDIIDHMREVLYKV